MKYVDLVIEELKQQQLTHAEKIYNYAIPCSWNFFGLDSMVKIIGEQLLVNPYTFYYESLKRLYHSGKYLRKGVKQDSSKWVGKSVIYTLDIGVCSAWDHDRDGIIDNVNIYQLADSGTFLKAMHLLMLYQQMGINTIILENLIEVSKSQSEHKYAKKEAVKDFKKIKKRYGDPMLSLSVEEQLLAFIEACHYLGIRVISEVGLARIGRDNVYLEKHPQWFYWIKKAELADFNAPICGKLPQNTLPYEYTLKDYYNSSEVQAHIKKFVPYQKRAEGCVAPYFSDQINAATLSDDETCLLKFYDDEIYMSADKMRTDIYPGVKKNADLWKMLLDVLGFYHQQFGFDGYYITQTYLMPQEFLAKIATQVKGFGKNIAVMVQESNIENAIFWGKMGYQAISGNSAYEVSKSFNKFRQFVETCGKSLIPVLFGVEAYDYKRVNALEQGDKIAGIHALFAPFVRNAIPCFLQGIECKEKQVCQLSMYGDRKALYCEDRGIYQYGKQGYLDEYCMKYGNKSISDYIGMMQVANKYREKYRKVVEEGVYLSLWFDNPNVEAYGILYLLGKKAFVVVCNTSIYQDNSVNIHLENIEEVSGGSIKRIVQAYSSVDPYTHEIVDIFNRKVGMDFAQGEVKYLILEWA